MKTSRVVPGFAVVVAGALAVSSAFAAPAVLPFVENDLPRALAEARERDLPLFVESWAPW